MFSPNSLLVPLLTTRNPILQPDEDGEDIYIIPYTPLQSPTDSSTSISSSSCGTSTTPDHSQDQSLLTESILFCPIPGNAGSDRPDLSSPRVLLPTITLTPHPRSHGRCLHAYLCKTPASAANSSFRRTLRLMLHIHL